MSVLETIKKRFSCRKFEQKPVEKEKINKIIESARLSPSAMNQQAWFFRVVTNQKKNDEIGAIIEPLIFEKFPGMKQSKSPGQRSVLHYDAPVVIYCSVYREAFHMKYIDLGLAVESMALEVCKIINLLLNFHYFNSYIFLIIYFVYQ